MGVLFSALCVSDAHGISLTNKLINLSNNQGNSSDPDISAYDNNVYAVWTDNELGNNEIFFKRSIDGGNTFGSTENLSVTNGSSILPQIAVSDNYVYIFWTDYSTGNGDIYVRASIDGGNTFSPVKNLSNNLNGTELGVSSYAIKNRIFVIWKDKTGIDEVIRLKTSSDAGLNFNYSKILSKREFVTLSDQLINETSKSGQNEFDFSRIKQILQDVDSSKNISFTSDGQSLFVVWKEETKTSDLEDQWDLRFRMISTLEENITFPKSITKNIGDSADSQQILINNNTIYITWSDKFRKFNQNDNDIFMIISNNFGKKFNDPVNLSEGNGNSIKPKMSSGNGNVYVIWAGYVKGNGEIYLKIIK